MRTPGSRKPAAPPSTRNSIGRWTSDLRLQTLDIRRSVIGPKVSNACISPTDPKSEVPKSDALRLDISQLNAKCGMLTATSHPRFTGEKLSRDLIRKQG